MKINEENFVAQLNKRNEDALVYVMRTYGGLVKSVVHRHIKQLSVYEDDCINEVFFAVWEHADAFIPEKGSFANWIAGIARFKALDYLRRFSKQMKEEHIEDKVIDISAVIQGENDSVEDTVFKRHMDHAVGEYALEDADDGNSLSEYISEEMEQMLFTLNDTDRELFIRLYVEEQKVSDVSRDMNMDRSVIYNRLSRSKKKLRKLYGRE